MLRDGFALLEDSGNDLQTINDQQLPICLSSAVLFIKLSRPWTKQYRKLGHLFLLNFAFAQLSAVHYSAGIVSQSIGCGRLCRF